MDSNDDSLELSFQSPSPLRGIPTKISTPSAIFHNSSSLSVGEMEAFENRGKASSPTFQISKGKRKRKHRNSTLLTDAKLQEISEPVDNRMKTQTCLVSSDKDIGENYICNIPLEISSSPPSYSLNSSEGRIDVVENREKASSPVFTIKRKRKWRDKSQHTNVTAVTGGKVHEISKTVESVMKTPSKLLVSDVDNTPLGVDSSNENRSGTNLGIDVDQDLLPRLPGAPQKPFDVESGFFQTNHEWKDCKEKDSAPDSPLKAGKKLFYRSSRPSLIKPLQKDDDILNLHVLAENFDDCIPANNFRLKPTKHDLLPSNVFADQFRKRPSSPNFCSDIKNRKIESDNCVGWVNTESNKRKIEAQQTKKTGFKAPELVTTGWNSHTQYLQDSQAIVSDTQIVKVTEDLESAMLPPSTAVSIIPKRQSRAATSPSTASSTYTIPVLPERPYSENNSCNFRKSVHFSSSLFPALCSKESQTAVRNPSVVATYCSKPEAFSERQTSHVLEIRDPSVGRACLEEIPTATVHDAEKINFIDHLSCVGKNNVPDDIAHEPGTGQMLQDAQHKKTTSEDDIVRAVVHETYNVPKFWKKFWENATYVSPSNGIDFSSVGETGFAEKSLFANEYDEDDVISFNKPGSALEASSATGFCTGGGQQICVSRESLMRAEGKFTDEESDCVSAAGGSETDSSLPPFNNIINGHSPDKICSLKDFAVDVNDRNGEVQGDEYRVETSVSALECSSGAPTTDFFVGVREDKMLLQTNEIVQNDVILTIVDDTAPRIFFKTNGDDLLVYKCSNPSCSLIAEPQSEKSGPSSTSKNPMCFNCFQKSINTDSDLPVTKPDNDFLEEGIEKSNAGSPIRLIAVSLNDAQADLESVSHDLRQQPTVEFIQLRHSIKSEKQNTAGDTLDSARSIICGDKGVKNAFPESIPADPFDRTMHLSPLSKCDEPVDNLNFNAKKFKNFEMRSKSLGIGEGMVIADHIFDSEAALETSSLCRISSVGNKKQNTEPLILPLGFTTGTGKAVEVMEDSINKVRKMFDGEPVETIPEAMPGVSRDKTEPFKFCMGFTTGTGKTVNILDSSLVKGREMFADTKNPEMKRMPSDTKLVLSESGLDTSTDCSVRCEGKSMSNESGLNVFAGMSKKIEQFDEKNKHFIGKLCQEPVVVDVQEKKEMNQGDLTSLLIFEAGVTINAETSFAGVEKDSKRNEVVTTTHVCDESVSALLENTDWEEPIVQNWIEDSLSQSEVNLVLEKRKSASKMQIRLCTEKHGVKPLRGSFLLQKTSGGCVSWRQILPEGPSACVRERQRQLGVKDFVFGIDFDNAADFRFYAPDFYRQSTCDLNSNGLPVGDGLLLIFDQLNYAGYEEFERAFLAGAGVDPKLVPTGWLRNHYRLIVWKLACYERNCQGLMAGIALTPHNVMLQLKYRYDLEIDRSRSSALKRICERDDSAAKPMVLCVVKIGKGSDGYSFEVTDGWYVVGARADRALDAAVQSGTFCVGAKIMTIGAALVGSEEGAPPLEVPSGTYLKLATNSTRRVPWYTKLGFQNLRTPPAVLLKSVAVGGGSVCRLNVVILRVYPVVYVEKLEGGRNITRNARSEQNVAAAFQQKQEAELEQLCSQLQRDESSKASSARNRFRRGRINVQTLARVKSPEELCDILENAPDPSQIENMLSDEQKSAILAHHESRRASAQKLLEEKIKSTKMQHRNVSNLLRVKVTGASPGDDKIAILSWWNPPEDITHVLVEGKACALYNVTPGKSTNQLYLNSTRQSTIELLSVAPGMKSCARKVTHVSDITSDFKPDLGELDVVGLVVYIHEICRGANKMATVYLTDTGESFFGLIFWRGLEEFGYETTLTEGCVVSVSNVQWRSNSSANVIPCGYVSEVTVASCNPKHEALSSALNALKGDLEEADLPSFISECQDSIISQLEKYKFRADGKSDATSLMHVPNEQSLWNKTSAATSTPRPQYLNGFALRPQAASTPVRTPAQSRIERLKEYGELPPISPLPLMNSSSLAKSFNAPLAFDSPSMEL